jgi:hypothetical protein
MIRETATNFDPAWGELLDVDVLDSGDWAGLFRTGEGLFIRTVKRCIPAPNGTRFPLIRSLDPDRCVLVDTRTQEGRVNGWVLSLGENGVQTFFAGDGIQDVLANPNTIVVTYFDEGVFGTIKPSQEGVAIFTSRGQLRVGYQSLFGSEAVDIADCYAACWEEDSRIAFLPYTGFPLVRFDLRTLGQHVEPTPRAVHGSSAISVSGGAVLFYGSYDERTSILSWKPQSRPSTVGRHPGPLRGLRGGRFLTHGTSGFTIVDAAQHGVAAPRS